MPAILITGGNSLTARHLIDTLLNNPNCPSLRILVRPGGAQTLQQVFPKLTQPPHGILVADYMDEPTLTPAFRDIFMVIHNGPSIHQNEAAMAISVIDAAKSAGVSHFLFCSVLHPMLSKLVTHNLKLQVEEYLVESRMNYTIVQPTHYMQNVSLGHVKRTGKIPLGYSLSVEQGFVDLRDVCLVLRSIILDSQVHNLATYELVSENLTYEDVAKTLQRVMHREVECEVIPRKSYIAMLKEGKVVRNEYTEDATERIMIYHDRWGLTGNSNVLRWLLGRKPRAWQQYAAEMLLDV